jgi:hypothetical protein
MALADRHKTFAHAYVLNGGNGKAAAISVGVSEASAAVTANRWLKRSEVKAEVTRLSAETLYAVNDAVNRELSDPINTAAVLNQSERPSPRKTGDAEVDRDVLTIVTRRWLVQGLKDNVEMCLGRKRAPVVEMVVPPATTENPDPKPVRQEVERRKHDASGANAAIALLLKQVDMAEGIVIEEDQRTIDGEAMTPLEAAMRAFRAKRGLPPPDPNYDPTKEESYP